MHDERDESTDQKGREGVLKWRYDTMDCCSYQYLLLPCFFVIPN
jgi:hypothetical protein